MGRCVEINKPISDIFKDRYRYRHRYLEYRIPTIKYLKVGSVRYFIYSSLFRQPVFGSIKYKKRTAAKRRNKIETQLNQTNRREEREKSIF